MERVGDGLSLVCRERLDGLEVAEDAELLLHRPHLVLQLRELCGDLLIERVDLVELHLSLLELLVEPRRGGRRVVHLHLLEVEVGLDLGELGRREARRVVEELALPRDGAEQTYDLRLRLGHLLNLLLLLLVECFDELRHLLVPLEELLVLLHLGVDGCRRVSLQLRELRAPLAERILRLGDTALDIGDLCVVRLDPLQQHLALLGDRQLRAVELLHQRLLLPL
mmetsp:Transcript_32000/g.68798  ORF Transcript_32000/g.68798 Transcript_32000/m.68798 type:complete len:224 (-) Transcript_32000:45-716(-)